MLSCWSFDDSAWADNANPIPGLEVREAAVRVGTQAVPLDDATAARAMSAVTSKREAVLEWASLNQKGELRSGQKEAEAHSAFLLVHLGAGAGPHSSIRFQRIGNIDERVLNGRVVRSFNTFPPVGVRVLAEHIDEDGIATKLLEMLPGASFKIVRRGDLSGAPSMFKLTWTGIGWETEAGGAGKKRKRRTRVVL